MIANIDAPHAETRLSVSLVSEKTNRTVDKAGARRLHASISEFLTWSRQHLDLVKAFDEVPDGRDPAHTRIPLAAILFALLLMFLLGLPSIRALDDRLAHNSFLRRILGLTGWQGRISDDTIAEALGRLDLSVLQSFLHRQGLRELKRWRAGRYRQCELAKRLAPIALKCPGLLARALVAIDGHELFWSEHRRCPLCSSRQVEKKNHKGETYEVTEYYHRIVVAQWVGVHPAIILDFEVVKPNEGELTAAYRLVERLGSVYGKQIGTVVVDGLYTGTPFRGLLKKYDYAIVVRLKGGQAAAKDVPGWWFEEESKQEPIRRHLDPSTQSRYETWEVTGGNLRYVRAQRIRKVGERTQILSGVCITNLPIDSAPSVAVALVMESRWWIENSAFHELAGPMHLDRAFVHVGRPTAIGAIVTLAFLAYNALQAYVYRHLGLNPKKPERTLGDLKRDLVDTLPDFRRQSYQRPPPQPI